MQAWEAVECRIARPHAVDLTGPEVGHDGMGQKTLVPLVHRDREDDVEGDGDCVDYDQGPAEGVASPVFDEAEVEHGDYDHRIEKVDVEDHHLRDEWNQVVEASRKEAQVETRADRVERPGPIIGEPVQNDVEEKEHQDDVS